MSTTFRAVNPATGQSVEPEFTESSAAEVDAAFERAERAFRTYSQTSLEKRAEFLRAIADELETLGAELTERAHLESGLPNARLEGERGRTTGQLRLFAAYIEKGEHLGIRIDRPDAARAPLPKPDLRRMLVPLGPVAVFGASNFPLAFSVPGGDTASALAAGCTIVCKAHPAHPGTSELCGKAIAAAAERTGMPKDVFALVHGWSHEVGLAMVRNRRATAVGFTGSLRGGRALVDAAAARDVPIPVYAEMGSVNPVFLLPSAVRERGSAIASGLAASITMGVGQFCTNPGVIVGFAGKELDEIQSALATQIAAAPAGTMLYDGLSKSYLAAISSMVANKAEQISQSQASVGPSGALPTLLRVSAADFCGDERLRQEMFGPVSVVVAARDADELQRVAQSMEGQLTATIHGTGDELTEFADLLQTLTRKVGRLLFNGYPTGVEVGHAMQHGGPYPASSDSRTTSVGSAAIERFLRPVCYQNFPESALPFPLRDANPTGIWRMIDGEVTKANV